MGLISLLRRFGVWIHAHPTFERSIDILLRPFEKIAKIPVFGCKMCGQCVLHSTGLVCPMTCPKVLRNGPCGGVRLNGTCEVYPDRQCVWVRAYNQSQRLFWPHEIHDLRPAVDWSLQGSSSWLNYLTGRDQIAIGCNPRPDSALLVVDHDE